MTNRTIYAISMEMKRVARNTNRGRSLFPILTKRVRDPTRTDFETEYSPWAFLVTNPASSSLLR